MIKNFWCSRRLLIILSVLGAISALSLFFAPYAIGVSDENIEAKARKFHNIEDSWQVVKNSNENIFAMIFFLPIKVIMFIQSTISMKDCQKVIFLELAVK